MDLHFSGFQLQGSTIQIHWFGKGFELYHTNIVFLVKTNIARFYSVGGLYFLMEAVPQEKADNYFLHQIEAILLPKHNMAVSFSV